MAEAPREAVTGRPSSSSSPPRQPVSPVISASPVAALSRGEGGVSAPQKMEMEDSAVDSENRTIELEAESNGLKEENRGLVVRNEEPQKQCLDLDESKRRGETMSMKDKYLKTRDQSEERDELIVQLKEGVKEMKDREEMRDKFECGERNCSEEVKKAEENCRRLEVEKRKLEMDLEAAMRGGDEAVEAVEAVKKEITVEEITIEEYTDGTYKMLVKNTENLDKYRGASFQGNEEFQSSADKRRLEENEKMKFQELVCRFEASVRESREMKVEISKLKMEKSQDLERVLNEKLAMEKQNLELVHGIEAVESENVEMEAEVCKLKKAICDETARILEVNKALKTENVELEKRIEVLERTKEAEKKALRDENMKKVLELDQSINVLEKENREKSEEIKRILKDKMATESEERKWSEEVKMIEDTCRHLEVEKRKLEMDLDVAAKRAALSYDEVVEKLKAAEAKIEALKECKDSEITMLVKRNKHLDSEKIKIKEELQDWVLKMEEAVNKFTGATSTSHVGKQDKGNEDEQISARKKRLEEDEKMKAQELLLRIGVLEKEKGEMEVEVLKLEREISSEKENVLNKKMAMEAKEKKITELVQRIELLEKENREMEAKYANRERSEIDKILKEKIDVEAAKRTMKEEAEKEISKLVNKIGIFEREKRELEEEIMQKDEVIKVLVQENDCLEDKIKKLNNRRVVKSEEGADISQRVDLANHGCILGIPSQNQGQKSAAFPHSDEHNRSLNYVVAAAKIDVKIEDKMSSPLPENLTGGKGSENAVSLGGYGNRSIAKRKRDQA